MFTHAHVPDPQGSPYIRESRMLAPVRPGMQAAICIYIYIYMHMYLSLSLSIYIYIYIQ